MIPSRWKKLIKQLPIPLSRNHRYDLLTRRIVRRLMQPGSNCIDVGAHEGEVFDLFLKWAPQGRHFAFEPLPHLYEFLKKKYILFPDCIISPLALSSHTGTVAFNYVVSNPAYSGIKKRKYDRPHETDRQIEVETGRLDDQIPENVPIRLIKIDVEGGEMGVLEGATRILSQYHPTVIFEFGLGGSDVYGTTPEKIHAFFSAHGYRIYLLDHFLQHRPALTQEALHQQFYERKNYYFIADVSS